MSSHKGHCGALGCAVTRILHGRHECQLEWRKNSQLSRVLHQVARVATRRGLGGHAWAWFNLGRESCRASTSSGAAWRRTGRHAHRCRTPPPPPRCSKHSPTSFVAEPTGLRDLDVGTVFRSPRLEQSQPANPLFEDLLDGRGLGLRALCGLSLHRRTQRVQLQPRLTQQDADDRMLVAY